VANILHFTVLDVHATDEDRICPKEIRVAGALHVFADKTDFPFSRSSSSDDERPRRFAGHIQISRKMEHAPVLDRLKMSADICEDCGIQGSDVCFLFA
jgi:hypothetical protein